MAQRSDEPAEGGSARRIWIDAQLPPALAQWLQSEHGEDAVHVQDLGLLRARDSAIFAAAGAATELVVVMTKDDDFVKLQGQHGPPPHVVWLRCGNVANRELRRIVLEAWPRVAALSRPVSRSSRSAGAATTPADERLRVRPVPAGRVWRSGFSRRGRCTGRPRAGRSRRNGRAAGTAWAPSGRRTRGRGGSDRRPRSIGRPRSG